MVDVTITVEVGTTSDGTTVVGQGTMVGLELPDPYEGRGYRVTDDEGKVEFTGVQAGETATLLACGASYGTYDTTGGVTATAVLDAGLYGTVTDAKTGQPLAGVELIASQASHNFIMFTETNDNGRYTLPLVPPPAEGLYVDGGEQSNFVANEDIILTPAPNTPHITGGETAVAYGFSNTEKQDIAVSRE